MNISKKHQYRDVPIINDVDKAYGLSKAFSEEIGVKLTKPQWQLLSHLVSLISYESTIDISIDDLCERLGTSSDNLKKRLRCASHYIEYSTYRDAPELGYGNARIKLNPELGWKPSLTASREDATRHWYSCRNTIDLIKHDFILAYTLWNNI